jgi:L-lactate dehydrogenase complex protein LldF
VYERTGGHAYSSVYPGPIGAILTPQLRGMADRVDRSLPFASSLCGACYDVCPVRINIPQVLTHLRAKAVDEDRKHHHHPFERTSFRVITAGFDSIPLYEAGLAAGLPVAHALGGDDGFRRLPLIGGKWTQSRNLPQPPKESFRRWWQQHEDDG